MPSASQIELDFYEKFFFSTGLEPYPTQEQALDLIFRGASVLVTVPTGTGKTLIAKAALHKALASGQTAVYTTPLRALTEEKFRELAADFGEANVGFATGDYKVNPEAPLQVIVAEILWNRIYGDRVGRPADVVVMDEGHFFNDPERGYVWEQSIIGLDPRAQLVILSATIGDAQQFCHWVREVRRVEMELVEGRDRRVPLHHEFREEYLIDVVKQLAHQGDVPTIIFCFGREKCFETARLLKSCGRFTTDEEKARATALVDGALLERGVARDLKPLLLHGIGIHHAGILPRYKQLVERMTLDKLLKFVVSTETISAGINLPAKRVVFPELRKFISGKGRLLSSAEYHQMAGRAGRPQFDTEGIAITLAPEEVVQEMRKELKDKRLAVGSVEEARLKKVSYARARAAAQAKGDVVWDPDSHKALVDGKPAALKSQTKITAEQVLAIGLPDLVVEPIVVEGNAEVVPVIAMPPAMHLNIQTVLASLLLPDREKAAAHKRLAQVTDNLRAMGIVDEHGQQIAGKMINSLRGLDGLFVYYALQAADLDYVKCRELIELCVDHNVIHKVLGRKGEDAKREWCRARLRDRRREEPQVSWDDVIADWEAAHPRELTPVEKIHAEFLARVPHPELHGGKVQKSIWAQMEDAQLSFMDFVERESLATEEGSLFSYLIRVMKLAKMLHEATALDEFDHLQSGVRRCLAAVDERVLEE